MTKQCPPCSGNCNQGDDCPGTPLTFAETVQFWGIVVIAAVVFVAITAAVFG